MPNVSPIFLLRTKDSTGTVIQGATQIYKFLGNVVLTNLPGAREVQVNVGAPSSANYSFYEDFTTGDGNPAGLYGWYSPGSGTGSFVIDHSFGDQDHWGTCVLTADPSSVFTSAIITAALSNPIFLGASTLVCEIIVQLAALSTVTDEYIFNLGLADDSYFNGVTFQYDRANFGDFWNLRTIDGGVTTDFLTSEPVLANSWVKLKAVITNAANIDFYINDVLVGSITTNIPTGQPLSPSYQIDNTANSNPSQFISDLFIVQATLNR